MRLINADELMKDMKSECPESDVCVSETSCIECIIDRQPTVDAVPVVRCGECKYMMPCGRCTMFADDKIRPSVSDFCSHGERGEAK